MLRSDTFWIEEKDAPLLKLNYGYLQRQGPSLFDRVSNWLASAGVDASVPVSLKEVDNPDRILVADSERTFRSATNREKFVQLLDHLVSSFGDYAQGVSFVASFLLLTMNEADVIALVSRLNLHEQYVPGYWKAEATKFTTDAYVFQKLLTINFPQLSAHLQKSGVDASVYCQKYFVGLCVHVLPFEYLYPYFEGFFEGGYKFLMKFALSLLNQLQPKLLAASANDPSTMFGLLRLDPKYIPHDEEFSKMLDRVFAGVDDFKLDDFDFAELREQAYNTHLKARMDRAREAAKEPEEIEDCQVSHFTYLCSSLFFLLLQKICLEDFPEVYCKECKLKVSPLSSTCRF